MAAKEGKGADTVDTAAKVTRKRSLEIEHRYTSATLDPEVKDLTIYDQVRSGSVDESLAFLNALTQKMDSLVDSVYQWMADPSTNPFKGLYLPRNISDTSLTELMDLLSLAQNAYQQFAEIRSVLSAVSYQRQVMVDRRKTQALINEGSNEQERKGLSALRSDPELLLLARSQMALEWAEARYYAYGKMVDSIQQLMTTKSVEATRQQKDAQQEWSGH